MEGLATIPSLKDLEIAYRVLQGDEPVDEKTFALYSQWVRFDPRLGEIWTQRFARDWETLRPILLREMILLQPWPAAFGVLIEQTLRYGSLERERRRLFRATMNAILIRIDPAPYENFFIGLAPFAGKSMREDAEKPLKSYLKWGFFGREILMNKAELRLQERAEAPTDLDPEKRHRILDELLSKRPRITIADYVEKLEGRVSTRVAQLDLSKRRDLKAVGRTRGRFYVKRAK